MVRLDHHQLFNRDCLNRNLIPRRLRCKYLVDAPFHPFGGHPFGKVAHYSRNCLKARIGDSRQRLTQLRRRLGRSERHLRSILRLDGLRNVFVARKQAEELGRQKMHD